MKRNFAKKAFAYILLLIISIVWLLPNISIIIASIRPREELALGGWWSFPKELTFANFQIAWVKGKMARYLMNSFIISSVSTFVPVFIGSLAGYAFAKLSFKGKEHIFLTILIGMIIPVQVLLIPQLVLLERLNLVNTFPGIWLIHTVGGIPWIVFAFRNFFADFSNELLDTARIDGCSEFYIWLRIVMPLSLPALATISSLQFIWVWNDLLKALVFLRDVSTRPITVGLVELRGPFLPEWTFTSAGAIMALLPPLFVFIFLQKYLIKGILGGAVKG